MVVGEAHCERKIQFQICEWAEEGGLGGTGEGADGAVEEREWGVRQRGAGVLVIVKIWAGELRRLTFDFTNNLFELVISCPLCMHWQWLMLFIM